MFSETVVVSESVFKAVIVERNRRRDASCMNVTNGFADESLASRPQKDRERLVGFSDYAVLIADEIRDRSVIEQMVISLALAIE
jgi:hypothetical protein